MNCCGRGFLAILSRTSLKGLLGNQPPYKQATAAGQPTPLSALYPAIDFSTIGARTHARAGDLLVISARTPASLSFWRVSSAQCQTLRVCLISMSPFLCEIGRKSDRRLRLINLTESDPPGPAPMRTKPKAGFSTSKNKTSQKSSRLSGLKR